ncbi:MAG: hypothetical protein RIA65_04300 [Woeseia sp.]
MSASGIHGQFLHVAPEAGMVVTVFASWPRVDGGEDQLGWQASSELSSTIIANWRDR